MSAVERLEAAIAKLEALKAESTSGPWRDFEIFGGHWFVIAIEPGSTVGESVAAITSNDGDNEDRRQPTAELIVTLHRTIDAQLAILVDTRSLFRDPIPMFAGHEERICAAQLALADAILGGAS